MNAVEETANTPKLRFPEFEREWDEAHAGDAFSNSRKKGEVGLPIYSVTLDRGLVRRDSLERHMGPDADEEMNLRAESGDLVYNMMRMWQGAVGKAPEECMISPAYVVLSPRKNTSPEFFYQWFKASRMLYLLWAYSQGLTSDRLRLYYRHFAQIPLTLPTLPEQKKIAAFLGAVDEKLAALRKKRDLLADYKRGVMQQIFSQTRRFTREDGAAFPDWEEKRLWKIAVRITSKNSDFEHIRVLTNSAVQGVVDQGEYFDKEIANTENLGGYYVVEKGDYVYNPRISVSAPVGPINRNQLGTGVMSPLYLVFRFNFEDTRFFDQYFKSSFWHRYMKSVANYGARHDRMAITSGDLMKLPISLPHPDEQKNIADFLSTLDTKISAVADQITQMEAFKKGLLQQMFV